MLSLHRVTPGAAARPRRPLDAVVADLPNWVHWVVAAWAVAVAALAVAQMGVDEPVAVAFVFAAVLPWPLGCVTAMHDRRALHATWTIACLGVVNIVGVEWGWVGSGASDQTSIFVAIWLVGEMTATASARTAWATAVAALGLIFARAAADQTFDATAVWVAGVFLAIGAGAGMRVLSRTIIELRSTQEQLAREAAATERRRIAREIHDVVAHSLSATMLHVTAARLAVGRGDTGAAHEALEEAERVGRASLADIRRTVGLLRDHESHHNGGVAAPLPAAAEVRELVDTWAVAGLGVRLEVNGDLASVDSVVGLALYRIVQEALSNAARHRPGSFTVVRCIVTPASIHLGVETAGGEATLASKRAGGGHGVPGMAERARALGGWLRAGAVAGGWEVRAELPRSAEPAATR